LYICRHCQREKTMSRRGMYTSTIRLPGLTSWAIRFLTKRTSVRSKPGQLVGDLVVLDQVFHAGDALDLLAVDGRPVS
jgi:hypothetical protein